MSESPARTPEQMAAIEIAGVDVLLEAGAGTGKTGVMVDRYCRLVVEKGVSPEAILAFTFTDKAAAELRARIRAELTRLADAGSARAAGLLTTIGSAWVTTIHGFCNRILAAHPVAAGVDPGFRVLDAPEAERAAREAFDAAVATFLGGGDAEREETVAAYGIESLRGILAGVHAELRSRGEAEPVLPEPPVPDVGAALAEAEAAAEDCLAELDPDDAKGAVPAAALAGLRASGSPPDLDELRALRGSGNAKPLAGFHAAIEAAAARAAEAGPGGLAYRHLAELLRLFGGAYEEAKARRGGIDFEDLQILAARLLERSETGDSYRIRFAHILVDEFQDTNRLQLRLIAALRGPRTELVEVGDELQSIYSFRHADLDVFRAQREAAAARDGAELLALSGNFRSRPEVVGAVNLLGSSLLGDGYRDLRVGAVAADPAPGEAAVELVLTAEKGWDEEGIDLEPGIDARTPLSCLAEARAVAARLRELADGGVPRADMVVLLRAFTHLDAYEDSLERAGLRPYVVGGRGYWSQQQVADVRALLAAIANPLDDAALFGALASPAAGAAPDTLWLLRAAAGRRRHVWPALERVALRGEAEVAAPERLDEIPGSEVDLLRRFAATLVVLRRRGPRLGLASLVEAAITETGYDLAVLMRPAGEARLANARKLGRLAADFEEREGRDLRGFLDYLETRSEVDAEAQAATAAEGHDGVRVMTVHNAKGLEFDVVAVPDLSRSLLAGSRAPVLPLGRSDPPAVGLQWRRLGAPAMNLYGWGDLYEEAKERDAAEGLRLFHVAATRARERLLLSGVVKANPSRSMTAGRSIVERIVEALGVERDVDGEVEVPAPEPRLGLAATFAPSRLAVRANLPSPERAAALTRLRREPAADRPRGSGPPPITKRRPPVVPSRPLSYTAISAYEACPYRFFAERVLGLPAGGEPTVGAERAEGPSGREERTARGAAVHALLEWSAGSGWAVPGPELAARHGAAAGLSDGVEPETLVAPVRAWLDSPLRVEIDGAERVRAEVPLLLGTGGTVLRGSIDLLVERADRSPLVVDYKTDRLGANDPAALAERYDIQRSIYALAVAESLEVAEVEVAYVFLERPAEPVRATLGPEQMSAGRERIEAAVAAIGAGSFPAAAPKERSWDLCRGCPALAGLCSGPEENSD